MEIKEAIEYLLKIAEKNEKEEGEKIRVAVDRLVDGLSEAFDAGAEAAANDILSSI